MSYVKGSALKLKLIERRVIRLPDDEKQRLRDHWAHSKHEGHAVCADCDAGAVLADYEYQQKVAADEAKKAADEAKAKKAAEVYKLLGKGKKNGAQHISIMTPNGEVSLGTGTVNLVAGASGGVRWQVTLDHPGPALDSLVQVVTYQPPAHTYHVTTHSFDNASYAGYDPKKWWTSATNPSWVE